MREEESINNVEMTGEELKNKDEYFNRGEIISSFDNRQTVELPVSNTLGPQTSWKRLT